MSSIWQDVQAVKQALRQLREDVDGLLDAYVRQSQDRHLDSLQTEALRVTVQRLAEALVGVKEALRQFADGEEDW